MHHQLRQGPANRRGLLQPVAAGFSGHGFGIGPGAGKLMADMTGTESGVKSMAPAHACATLAPANAGNARATFRSPLVTVAGRIGGSSTRTASNGVGASRLQRAPAASSAKSSRPTRSRT